MPFIKNVKLKNGAKKKTIYFAQFIASLLKSSNQISPFCATS
jgi:hypothetical protein